METEEMADPFQNLMDRFGSIVIGEALSITDGSRVPTIAVDIATDWVSTAALIVIPRARAQNTYPRVISSSTSRLPRTGT